MQFAAIVLSAAYGYTLLSFSPYEDVGETIHLIVAVGALFSIGAAIVTTLRVLRSYFYDRDRISARN